MSENCANSPSKNEKIADIKKAILNVVDSSNREFGAIGKNIRGLLIDDDEKLLWILTKYFESDGFEIITATNGVHGIDAIHQRNPDFVICDYVMNEKNGLHVCKQIRSEGYQMPFIILTANISHEDHLEGYRAGADDYVTKPFDPGILLEKVSALLKRSKQGA